MAPFHPFPYCRQPYAVFWLRSAHNRKKGRLFRRTLLLRFRILRKSLKCCPRALARSRSALYPSFYCRHSYAVCDDICDWTADWLRVAHNTGEGRLFRIMLSLRSRVTRKSLKGCNKTLARFIAPFHPFPYCRQPYAVWWLRSAHNRKKGRLFRITLSLCSRVTRKSLKCCPRALARSRSALYPSFYCRHSYAWFIREGEPVLMSVSDILHLPLPLPPRTPFPKNRPPITTHPLHSPTALNAVCPASR